MAGKTIETDYVLCFPNNFEANTGLLDGSNYSEEMKFDKAGRICPDLDLNTGLKRVFTAGSCCAPMSFTNSERIKFFSLADSINQGIVAGYNISGMGVPYATVPYREWDFYGHKFRDVGTMNYFEEAITEGDLNSFDFMVYYLNKGIGVMKAAGFPKRPKDMQILRECLRTSVPIGGDPENPVMFRKVNINKLEKYIRVA